QTLAALTAPTKALETLVLQGRLRHGGNPILRWNASNVTVEQDSNENLKVSKKRSTERIDGISALVNARAGAITQIVDSGLQLWISGAADEAAPTTPTPTEKTKNEGEAFQLEERSNQPARLDSERLRPRDLDWNDEALWERWG